MKLNNGVEMPNIGLGTFRSDAGEETYNSVLWALQAGYRHIDTAMGYDNEESVGLAIKDSNIKREEIFVTSKLKPNMLGYENAKKEIMGSIKRLGLNYIDLYLIHWPSHNSKLNSETWKAFEEAYNEGIVRAIGVSNFNINHLEDLLKDCNVIPMVDQVEMHPCLNQEPLRLYLEAKGIKMISYGPLMKGEVFKLDTLKDLAKKYNKSIPNIICKWGINRGIFMIPKSVTKERIIENLNIDDFDLSNEDMKLINNLNCGRRVYTDPNNNHLANE